ncbi:MAG: bifunctional ornithine acetyltransferase/N-acetylglutamate synthase [Cycloclasticus sp.]|nr:MAG: bifunctional ornithine acetyltransferase/N-acetylglutamate synthase [Cycloclasticus sp.]
MPVGGSVQIDLKSISGIRIGTSSAAICQTERDDLTIFELCDKTQVAAVFTKNKFCAAPVLLAKKYLIATSPKYLLINSGNANAGLGKLGVASAEKCCKGLADLVQITASRVLPFSTGVIGEPLPVNKILAALQSAVNGLDEKNWHKAANAIMTTDTCEKGYSRTVEIDGQCVTITGIAKGSGMIKPNMATMLSYIATDMPIANPTLQSMLKKAVDVSFNCITVDGDTSTNDAVILMATAAIDTKIICVEEDPRYAQLLVALTDVCQHLAKAIVRDGEGANKLIKVEVQQTSSTRDAKEIAYTVAHSPLVKTAFFASDPNWGRILAAVGRAKVTSMNVDNISIYLDEVCIVNSGMRATDYSEEKAQQVMNKEEITVRICMGEGSYDASIWTCDLSYDYVKINAEYRS